MPIEFGTTTENVNTQYGPIAALLAYYKQNQVLKPLEQVLIRMKRCDCSPQDKVEQVLVSILAGCPTLSEVNPKLKSEMGLAQVGGWPRIADQSGLSRTLDALTLMNIEKLGTAVNEIWHPRSQVTKHDWRGYLWLDFDLSGLPCSKRAQASQKGYFSDKKTPLADNWLGLVRSDTAKRSGLSCIQAISIRCTVSSQRS